jgi:taurine dioxygenase
MNAAFSVEPLAPAIGAEIRGLDLSKAIPKPVLDELRGVWLERKALVFRDQHLTPDQHVAFAGLFGELDKYPFLRGIEGHPLVAPILKRPEETVNFGGMWHSDTTYLETPALGAVLYALEIPPLGGDTLFANMALAFRELPEELKERALPLRVVCSSAKADITKTREDRLRDMADAAGAQEFVNVHPLVRTHPETGEKILYANEAHVVRFEGWSEEASEPLLQQLYQHQRKPEFQCRIRWGVGSVVMWDNRSTHHYPINDYHGHRRLLHRVSLKGDRPY